ncbi:SRPBCC family protein [Ruania alba]|uniref:Polyketide cyclase / dehydrase and lipid transport n=1 Tax=Ruania alba TaxID=648782 RepID=A0A1H5D1Z1_9MICO|nr:SRPBCC family protein [Ruania alba]SED72873.1 Polyketide cyclase / dehydrase and lipid transport [Ruania alba]
MATFVSTWLVAAPPAAAWAVLTATQQWPQWWPGFTRVVQVRAGDDGGVGQRIHLTLNVGYRLRFGTEIVAVQPGQWARARVVGDLRGTGIWAARPVRGGTEMTIFWDVQVQRVWMRALAPVAGGLFAAAHARVMAAGERGLRQELTTREPTGNG